MKFKQAHPLSVSEPLPNETHEFVSGVQAISTFIADEQVLLYSRVIKLAQPLHRVLFESFVGRVLHLFIRGWTLCSGRLSAALVGVLSPHAFQEHASSIESLCRRALDKPVTCGSLSAVDQRARIPTVLKLPI